MPPGPGSVTWSFFAAAYDKAAVLVCRLAWNHPLPELLKGRAVIHEEMRAPTRPITTSTKPLIGGRAARWSDV
jgi:hypothetical protein